MTSVISVIIYADTVEVFIRVIKLVKKRYNVISYNTRLTFIVHFRNGS